MRQVHLIAIIALTCLDAGTSSADFALKSENQLTGPAQATRTGIVADQPHVDPGDSHPATLSLIKPAHPHLVTGFGNQVPLSFACRQVVPRQVRVAYGPGASPDALVDWKGGDVWPLVLGRAIQPLGLRMVAVGTKLTIKH